MTRKITASTMVELKSRIYKIEGWRRHVGESMATRIKRYYDVDLDFKHNRIVAIRKEVEK